ncbi:ParB/RepB/Spo0J family partition protein [Stackebrandtia soli]|uniref:ParB/RepB/Spo0J family partition protein n=1 Tax=Stackebrandtia soli TaxID=1892856 RepID=UPI0039E88B5A
MRKKGGLGKGLAALIPSTVDTEPETVSRETEEDEGTPPRPPRQPAAVSRETTPVKTAPRKPARATAAPEPEEDDDAPELVPVPGARFQLVRLDAIDMNPKQPRQVFDDAGLAELKVSLSEVGLLQPIAVRPGADDRFELIMGERRTRAAAELGWETIPAIVRQTKDDELLRDALMENIHRVQLNPLEEGAAYQQLLEEFGVTQEELSRRIGRSRPQISNTIRLLALPPSVQRRVAAGVLSAGHARALLGLKPAERQEALAQRIVEEGLSVRTTEEIVTLAANDLPAVSRETAKRVPTMTAPGITDLADRLSDRFDTRVKVALGQRKGKIVIEFGSVADLERIAGTMGIGGAPAGD